MRQVWTRGGRRRRLGAAVAVASAVVLVGASPTGSAPSGSAATPSCSEATARGLVEQHRLNAFLLPDPVRQVLCGPFTGEGSEAMAVTIGAPTCWGIQRWVVFRLTSGTWQLVHDRSEFVFAPLVAVGGDIRVRTPVFRPGDARCLPSGGSQARTWHWDGSRFVAGPPQQVTPGDTRPRGFWAPGNNVDCFIGDSSRFRGVFCQSQRRMHSVRMGANGRLKICLGRGCWGCTCDEGRNPTLGYGRELTVGRFGCRSLRNGIRCTVTASGRGFLINRRGIARVGG